MKHLTILGFVLATLSLVNGDFGEGFFEPGKKYVYSYSSSLLTGSKDYVSFAGAANLTGELHIGGNATWLNVHLKNIQIGFYNGEWDLNSEPEFHRKSFPQLEPLSQPFSLRHSQGLVLEVLLNKDIPLWAKNMQRGIAYSLLIQLPEDVDFKNASEFSRYEKTVFEKCSQNYNLIPGEKGDSAQVRRTRRDHCSERRVFTPDTSREYCSRAIFSPRQSQHQKSHGFGVYDLELQSGSWVVKRISVESNIVHTPFGTGDHSQFSSGKMDAILKETFLGSVAGPVDGELTGLKFEYENDADEDPKRVKEDQLHQNEAVDKLLEKMKELNEAFESSEPYLPKLDNVSSPLSLIPIISHLDYDHLKEVEGQLRNGNDTEYKFFLDALLISGTGPTTLLIRDIIQKSNDTELIRRVISPLASYVRHPTERLLQELEPLLNKSGISSEAAQLIQLSFATLLGRTCEMNYCVKSGLLRKYVRYFSHKFNAASGFKEKSVAVHSLGNIQLRHSMKVLLKIALDKKEEHSVRYSAISGLGPNHFYPEKRQLLRVFYDRGEDAELRNKALITFLTTACVEEVFLEVARFMWTEEDANVKNFVATFFHSLAGKYPVIAKYAQAALPSLPPWQVSERYSRQSLLNFFDRQHRFGHMTMTTVEKTGLGDTRSINIRFLSEIQDYRTNYFSAFLRLEGVVWRRGAPPNDPTDFEHLAEILKRIGVEKRESAESEQIKIEIVLMLHNRVVSYFAFDLKNDVDNMRKSAPGKHRLALANNTDISGKTSKVIRTVPAFLNGVLEKEVYRILSFGGITVEQPNDLGFPVSVSSALTAVLGVQPKGAFDLTPDPREGYRYLFNHRLRLNFHGEFSVTSHLPGFDAALSVRALRSLRLRVPAGLGVFNGQIVLDAPTDDYPISAKFHSIAVTSVDSFSHKELVKETCPTCESIAQISKGAKYRKEGQHVDSKIIPGMRTGIKYFDCENNVVSKKMDIFRSLKSIFGGAEESGIKSWDWDGKVLPQVLLRSHLLLETLFLSPKTESCALEGFVNAETINEIEERVKGPAAVPTHVAFHYLRFRGYSGKQNDVVLFRNSVAQKFGRIYMVALREGSRDHILCINSQTIPSETTPPFDYEGVNEPTYVNKLEIVWGTNDNTEMEEEEGRALCPSSGEGFNITSFGRRSIVQKEMAQSDLWPYKECREAKSNDSRFGGRISSMEPCFWAAVEQTTLCEANITIDYKLSSNKLWRYSSTIAALLLLPYEEEHVQSEDSESVSGGDNKYIRGRIKVNATMDEENPTADIAHEKKQYRNVDLSFIPRPWRELSSSRFSPEDVASMKSGDSSYCSVTPGSVQTYDNTSYYANLSECPTLLSGDCRDKPKFVILGHNIGADRLGLTVYFAEQNVEISELESATVDGKRVKPQNICYDDYMRLLTICRIGEDVVIFSVRYQVYIHYTGYRAYIQVSSNDRATVCGLCGNFDGNTKNEMIGPDKTSCGNLTPDGMMEAYVVRSVNCSSVGATCPK